MPVIDAIRIAFSIPFIYNKVIYKAEGKAKRVIKEARGYAIERTNEAKGDVQLFNNVSKFIKSISMNSISLSSILNLLVL